MIEVKNLSHSFIKEDTNGVKTENEVLKNISLSIEKGSFVAVLGHNGSGKSTLAKHLNGILIPTSGDVIINGINTKEEKTLIDIRRTVGMVFQNPDNQMVAAIVEDDVAFAPENLGVAPKEIRQRVDECLKTVGMEKYKKSSPANLSGGQKQRVAIASVLAMEPECIVLDEPTAMLDPHGRAEVMNTIHRLNKEKNMTVVLITHYMEEAATADRVIVIDDGEVMLDNSPKEVFRNVDILKNIGLDVPQVTELCRLLINDGIQIPDNCISVDECLENLVKLLEMRKLHDKG